MSNQDLFPSGAAPFQVKPRDVNDVPIVTLTLSSERYTDYQLRQLGDQVLEDAKRVGGTAGGFVVGGRGRELRVQIDPSRLKAYGLTPLRVAGVIQGENLAPLRAVSKAETKAFSWRPDALSGRRRISMGGRRRE